MKDFTPQLKLIDPAIPLVFTDGTSIYEQFIAHYTQHKAGYFILAPSGSGKTYFVKHQEQPHWIDGDDLWMMTNAHPDGAWWLEDLDTIMAIDARCDVITQEAKKLGLRIVGASNNWLKPDAIVVPDRETHKAWIKTREENHYDGGATSDHFDQVETHIAWILKWEEQGVPKFPTVQAAAEYLAKL
ncbi:MAG: hypothetical protein ABIS59_00335 [Candidatus Saccharibacteria bacterium]